MIILLFLITFITIFRSKQKRFEVLTIWGTNNKMENSELKEIRIQNRRIYYFDDITKIEDFDFDNILLHEKAYENILIYDISYKFLIGSKPLRIRLDKVDGFIRVYDGSRYLILFGSDKYDAIYNRIRYLILRGGGGGQLDPSPLHISRRTKLIST